MRIRSPALLVLGGLFIAVPAAFHAFARQSSHPDLIIDRQRLLAEWAVGLRYIPPDDCTIAEGCVLGPGLRKLLTFGVQTANISQTTLQIGDPTTNPNFEFSPCHGHYHMLEFSDYQIAAQGGGSLVAARKQDWCLVEVEQYIFEPWVPQTGFHDCDDQGILAGWSDIYAAPGLDCQWLDVTELPVGDYELTAIVNVGKRILEDDYSNNSVTIPVNVPDLSGSPDLILDAARMAATLRFEQKFISGTHPALTDCSAGFGTRRLIRFDTMVGNLGPSDLYLGDPAYQGQISFAPTHSHYHLNGFLKYQLFDLSGNPVLPARPAINWLPTDVAHYLNAPWVHPGRSYVEPGAGVQRGWYALNHSTRDCQWMDVTTVPDGRYRLRATVNPDGLYTESDLTNNTVEVEFTLTGTSLGIAHRPDGSTVPGVPMRVFPNPGGTRILYDVSPASCPAANYNVYYGDASPGSYDYTGAVCNVGNTGNTVIQLPDPPPGGLLWFNIVGRSGASEGGHGFDSQGQARPLSAVGLCGITRTLPRESCTAP